jgi:hypothetical protein
MGGGAEVRQRKIVHCDLCKLTHRWRGLAASSHQKECTSPEPVAAFSDGRNISENNLFALNELCFWTLSIVWCLNNKKN